jgi:hypothetical protein
MGTLALAHLKGVPKLKSLRFHNALLIQALHTACIFVKRNICHAANLQDNRHLRLTPRE